ncbi:MAG: serine dehydratase subunit alpha family protein [Clostridia bacterium]|nr:serine dehydratase subunit alpha family protein [Clostridia bacterium]
MEKTSEKYQAYLSILQEELITAMGCTEPIALAYAAAKCREILGNIPDKVEVWASGSIIKNVKSVIVPNTGSMKGIEAAVAAGIIAGESQKELEVISEVSEEKKKEIKEYLSAADITVNYLENSLTFEIIISEYAGSDHAKVRIANYHTNLIYMEKNGEILLDIPVSGENESGLTDRSMLNMEEIFEFASTCDVEDVKPVLDKQIKCNMAIANEGLQGNYGANIGSVWLSAYGEDIKSRAVAKAAAGSDARMNGCEMPVVINSGSGNQGITCSVPVIEFAENLQVDEVTKYRALVLSNLVAIHQKTGIGRLSAFCGAVCAGAAAGAGIAYLKGGQEKEIAHTVVNALAIISGMVCDGAKASCAAKIAFSVNAGILGYEMYMHQQQFYGGDGLVTKGVDNTIRNIGRLGREGMKRTNEEIIKIMVGSSDTDNERDKGSCDL